MSNMRAEIGRLSACTLREEGTAEDQRAFWQGLEQALAELVEDGAPLVSPAAIEEWPAVANGAEPSEDVCFLLVVARRVMRTNTGQGKAFPLDCRQALVRLYPVMQAFRLL